MLNKEKCVQIISCKHCFPWETTDVALNNVLWNIKANRWQIEIHVLSPTDMNADTKFTNKLVVLIHGQTDINTLTLQPIVG